MRRYAIVSIAIAVGIFAPVVGRIVYLAKIETVRRQQAVVRAGIPVEYAEKVVVRGHSDLTGYSVLVIRCREGDYGLLRHDARKTLEIDDADEFVVARASVFDLSQFVSCCTEFGSESLLTRYDWYTDAYLVTVDMVKSKESLYYLIYYAKKQ